MDTITDAGTRRYAKALGRLIREKRTTAGLSQAQLAEAVHVSQAAISQYESGAVVPNVARLNALLRALSIEDHEYLVVLGKAA